jgi:hypothetical protein
MRLIEVATQSGRVSPAERNDVSAVFVRKRLRLQHEIRGLKDAHEQGLALDMAFAAQQMVIAAKELATHLRSLLAYKARMEVRIDYRRAFVARKVRIKAQVKNALYECRALREEVADLFEACLRRETTEPSAAWPNGRSPAESYPWLRRRLEGYAMMIDSSLALHDE